MHTSFAILNSLQCYWVLSVISCSHKAVMELMGFKQSRYKVTCSANITVNHINPRTEYGIWFKFVETIYFALKEYK